MYVSRRDFQRRFRTGITPNYARAFCFNKLKASIVHITKTTKGQGFDCKGRKVIQ